MSVLLEDARFERHGLFEHHLERASGPQPHRQSAICPGDGNSANGTHRSTDDQWRSAVRERGEYRPAQECGQGHIRCRNTGVHARNARKFLHDSGHFPHLAVGKDHPVEPQPGTLPLSVARAPACCFHLSKHFSSRGDHNPAALHHGYGHLQRDVRSNGVDRAHDRQFDGHPRGKSNRSASRSLRKEWPKDKEHPQSDNGERIHMPPPCAGMESPAMRHARTARLPRQAPRDAKRGLAHVDWRWAGRRDFSRCAARGLD